MKKPKKIHKKNEFPRRKYPIFPKLHSSSQKKRNTPQFPAHMAAAAHFKHKQLGFPIPRADRLATATRYDHPASEDSESPAITLSIYDRKPVSAVIFPTELMVKPCTCSMERWKTAGNVWKIDRGERFDRDREVTSSKITRSEISSAA